LLSKKQEAKSQSSNKSFVEPYHSNDEKEKPKKKTLKGSTTT
jgi:hypothetical protein